MSRKVVVTGLGIVSSIGIGVKEYWNGIHEGRLGFSRIDSFDTEKHKCKLAGIIRDFDPTEYMDVKTAKRMERFAQFAIAATGEAMADSGLDMKNEDPFMVGCSISSGIGAISLLEKEYDMYTKRGPRAISPLFIPGFISNMAAGNVCIHYGLMGKSINVVTACAAGTNSIGEAFRTIQYGDADVMIAGGSESCISKMGLAGFDALKSLSTSEDITRCSIPFDKDRHGFIMGEGCGMLILEEYEHAVKRGAHIYAEMAGYGCSSDAYHITSPLESGAGAARAIENAIRDAGIETSDIKYINAHGTATKYNDLFETRAIKKVFGDDAYKLKVNSTKSMTGHLLGASGAVEAVTCILELREGYIHKTAGLLETEEEMDLDYCKEDCHMDFDYALSNSLGFGGHNASLVIKKYA